MATFDVLKNMKAKIGIDGAMVPKDSDEIPLRYTLNKKETWIYCNSPEQIPEDALGDSGKCFNQSVVGSGTHQLFYSYNNSIIKNKDINIRYSNL